MYLMTVTRMILKPVKGWKKVSEVMEHQQVNENKNENRKKIT